MNAPNVPSVARLAARGLTLMLMVHPLVPGWQHERQPAQEAPAIKLSTDLVSLSVMVTDHAGRAIVGLEKNDFRVYENEVKQQISFFSAEQAPATWGIILDRSGSMMGRRLPSCSPRGG